MAIHSMYKQLLHLTLNNKSRLYVNGNTQSSVGVVYTYCVLPLTYSLDLLFNVKCRSCSYILCIAINLQARVEAVS
jgi:hypothetical protein